MLNKNDFLSTHPEIHPHMDAYSLDGEKLGEVERLDEDSITIEKGWFFPRDFTIRYDDVVDIREDHLIVNRGRTDLDEWRTPDYRGWEEYDRAAGSDEEARIPLREEELEAEKTRREDEVRLHKVVHTEMKHMEVPVQKEEVVIERVPASDAGTADTGVGAFHEEETRIPIMEEEVQVSKRPVVKEEVRARKQTRTEQRDVSGEVRKEDVEVERGHKGRTK
jgi:uncharacterized protein (TIGR02271 family)